MVMKDEKNKILKNITGIEKSVASVEFTNKEISDYNEAVNEYAEKFQKEVAVNEMLKKQVVTEDLEIMPIVNNLLVKPYEQNPFQQITVSDSGLITDLGGTSPTYKSNETGRMEQEESFIKVAQVLEVGPETKYVKEGDVIMYTKPSGVPVPFFRQGFEMVNESRVMVIINEKLKERIYGRKDVL